MRRTPPGWPRASLAYCSNVHPCASLVDVEQVVQSHVAKVRELRGLDTMGAGLWLSADVAADLLRRPEALTQFRQLLSEQRIELFTLNGFPYENFHLERVKERVYRPDWSTDERLNYTLDLARILAACLPASCGEGTISTLPLGFAPDWTDQKQQAALSRLVQLVKGLKALQLETGKRIRVCLEMEPGCALESTPQAVKFFSVDLPAAMRQGDVPPDQASDHLGLCYDVCHQAVMHEDAMDSLRAITAAGIAIGKIQVSSAMQLADPEVDAYRECARAYAEPKYLHQVRARDASGSLLGNRDLEAVLDAPCLPQSLPWRIHFHVPVQAADLPEDGLDTTQGDILDVLDFLADTPECRPHLEVETYTWDVLPASLRPGNADELNVGLATELQWLEQAMRRRDLIEEVEV